MIRNVISRFLGNFLIIENLVFSALCGVGILVVYYITCRKISVSRGILHTLVLLPTVSCMVAIIISNDLVIAVGMVGSLSIIRFRHSMKESKNLVFIFWAVTAGIACGLSLRGIAAVSCVVIAICVLAVHYLTERRRSGTLAVRTSGGTEEIEDVLKEFALAYDVKYKSMNETTDMLYELKQKGGVDNVVNKIICEKIMSIKGVSSVKYIDM